MQEGTEMEMGSIRRRGEWERYVSAAGMAGMERWVREACIEELGYEDGKRVKIVDGVLAGVVWLEETLRMGRVGLDWMSK